MKLRRSGSLCCRILGIHGLLVSVLVVILGSAVPAHGDSPGTGIGQPDRELAGTLLFHSDMDGNDEIYTSNVDGSGIQRLTAHPASDVLPNGSPDGSRIAFDSDRDGNFEVYIMNADGSGLQRLTQQPGEDGFSSWSPDGARIAFYSTRDGDAEIFVMDASGANPAQITYNNAQDYDATWSPDGSHLAFMTRRHGFGEIYAIRVDGADERRLTNRSEDDCHPAWSPDGTEIVFSSGAGAANYKIWIMSADGSNQQQLTSAEGDHYFPAWSPDGTRIAFVSNRSGNFDIYTMNRDGTNQQRAFESPGNEWRVDWWLTAAAVEHSSDERAPVHLNLAVASPRLAGAPGALRLRLGQSAPVTLRVYDVLGRCVGELFVGHLSSGSYEVAWDGRDDSGRPLGTGLYVCCLAAASEVATRRVVILGS